MKEIRRIKMVEVEEVKFIADDGKEFVGENAEHECKTYERRSNEENVKRAFERLDTKQIDVPFVDWFCSEGEIWKVVLNFKQDYYTMTDYFKVYKNCCDDYTEMPTEFPCTVFVIRSWDSFDLSCLTVEEFKKKLEVALKQID